MAPPWDRQAGRVSGRDGSCWPTGPISSRQTVTPPSGGSVWRRSIAPFFLSEARIGPLAEPRLLLTPSQAPCGQGDNAEIDTRPVSGLEFIRFRHITVDLEGVRGLGDGPRHGLSGQAEPGPRIAMGQLVQGVLPVR